MEPTDHGDADGATGESGPRRSEVTVAVSLDPEVAADVEALARRNDATTAEVVRQLVDVGLENLE